MKNKIYISIVLWLFFIVLVVSYFTKNTEKQNQALKETQESILKTHEKVYNDNFKNMELLIYRMGNSPRDRVVQNNVQKGEIVLKSMFAEEKIENERILPFLYKNYYSLEVGKEVDDTEKILQELEVYKGNNEMIKQVNFIDRYQTSFYYLYKHYEKIGDYGIRFTKTNIVNVSDTTLGFEFIGSYDDYIIAPRNEVGWNRDSLNNLKYFRVNTYKQEDTITKMYKVISSKNGKPNPFDYEERE
jgi:hypothetical protein